MDKYFYRGMHEPADLETAKGFYELLVLIQNIEGIESVQERLDWVRNREPEIYSDLLIVDIMKAVKYGRKTQS